MTKAKAIEILMGWGWNYDGADAIASEIEDIENMTVEELKALHEEYVDR